MSPARKSTRKKKAPAKPPRSETRVELVAGDRSQRLGSKHHCFACGTKFYDLNKPQPICPKCQATAPHVRGTPCFKINCPKCGTAMIHMA